MGHYSFKPTGRAVGVFVVGFLLCVMLGFWQLHRAEERDAINALMDSRSGEDPVSLAVADSGEMSSLRYRRVWVMGEYDNAHSFLVDNQQQGGAVGYHVLTPFRIQGSEQAVMVNRGWLPLGNRAVLPNIAKTPSGQIRIEGTVDAFYRVGFRLAGAETASSGWPAVVQVPEPAPLGARLGYPVRPYQVLLSPAAESGYSRVWASRRLDSGKNRGYALQWFLFAATAAFFFVRHSLGTDHR